MTAQSHTLHCNHFVFCSLVCPNRGSHFALTSDMTLCPWRDSGDDEKDELDKEKKIDIFHLIILTIFNLVFDDIGLPVENIFLL